MEEPRRAQEEIEKDVSHPSPELKGPEGNAPELQLLCLLILSMAERCKVR